MQAGRAFLRGFVSIVAVGVGASLGREGALLQTGAASGSWLADRFGVSRQQARLLVACGAASGIAAAYNVPIGGALFGLEVLLGSFALELFGPVVVSCVTATIIARVVAGNAPAFNIPAYQLMRPSEVLVGLAMAPLLGVVSAAFVKVMGWVEVQLYRVPQGPARFLPPIAMALVGMAGVLAGTTHAAVSSVLIIFELTGDYGVILPLMLSAVLAAATSRAIEPESLYTAPLVRRGVKLPELPRPDWLRVTPVAALLSRGAEHVAPETPFRTLLPRLLSQPPGHDLYVTGEDERFLGIIALDHLKGTISDEALLAIVVAADVMHDGLPPVTASMTLAEVAARFAEADLERLPVVDEQRRLVGTVSKRDVMKHGRF